MRKFNASAGTVWCPPALLRAGNKRWCCGDRTHLDLSYAAFDQIAIRHRGVVDLRVGGVPYPLYTPNTPLIHP